MHKFNFLKKISSLLQFCLSLDDGLNGQAMWCFSDGYCGPVTSSREDMVDRKEQSLCEHDKLHTWMKNGDHMCLGHTPLLCRTQEGPFVPGSASEGTIGTHTLQWGDWVLLLSLPAKETALWWCLQKPQTRVAPGEDFCQILKMGHSKRVRTPPPGWNNPPRG